MTRIKRQLPSAFKKQEALIKDAKILMIKEIKMPNDQGLKYEVLDTANYSMYGINKSKRTISFHTPNGIRKFDYDCTDSQNVYSERTSYLSMFLRNLIKINGKNYVGLDRIHIVDQDLLNEDISAYLLVPVHRNRQAFELKNHNLSHPANIGFFLELDRAKKTVFIRSSCTIFNQDFGDLNIRCARDPKNMTIVELNNCTLGRGDVFGVHQLFSCNLSETDFFSDNLTLTQCVASANAIEFTITEKGGSLDIDESNIPLAYFKTTKDYAKLDLIDSFIGDLCLINRENNFSLKSILCDSVIKSFRVVNKPIKELDIICDMSNVLSSEGIIANKIQSIGAHFLPEAMRTGAYEEVNAETFVGFKKVKGINSNEDYILQLIIPKGARHNVRGPIVDTTSDKKHRCDEAFVYKAFFVNGNEAKEAKEFRSNYDRNFIYKIGETVKPSYFATDLGVECAGGIHFFTSFKAAKEY